MPGLILKNRAAVALKGSEAAGFLQGLITNNIHTAEGGKAIYAALLTPQGKYLFDFFIVGAGDGFLFDCEAARKDDLIKRLGFYKLRADVTIEDVSGKTDVWAFSGDPGLGGPEGQVYPDPRISGRMGFRGFLAKGGKVEETWAFEDYEAARLGLGLPDGSRDIEVDKRFILEANFAELGGVDFHKGCYVGQEMTARMTYRGSLKKRLMPVTVAGALPAPGDALLSGGKDAGHFCSGAGDKAIALIRLEYLTQPLATGAGDKVTVTVPDWLEIS